MTSQHVWPALWRSMRPGQWLKNLLAYAPLLFSAGSAWDPADGAEASRLLLRATLAVAVLCLAASGGYLLNDVHDADADRLHPAKRMRPVADGLLPADGAISAGVGLTFAALGIATFVNGALFAAVAAYVVLTLVYSFALRGLVIADVVAVAAGFALRIVVGATAIAVPVSGWIVLCTALGAAYVVLVKRMQERLLLHEEAEAHRPVQRVYGERGAARAAACVGVVTVIAYAAYALTASNLPPNHAMVVTVPLVAAGLARYWVAARRAPERNADELIARDRWLLLTVLGFAATAFAVLVIAR